ncbi:DDE endonuclease [Vibrio vulnificus]|nr:DDE endonuclease [Vibrio vulnificus]
MSIFPPKQHSPLLSKRFFDVTLPEVAGSLVSRITDNFQILKPAPSS